MWKRGKNYYWNIHTHTYIVTDIGRAPGGHLELPSLSMVQVNPGCESWQHTARLSTSMSTHHKTNTNMNKSMAGRSASEGLLLQRLKCQLACKIMHPANEKVPPFEKKKAQVYKSPCQALLLFGSPSGTCTPSRTLSCTSLFFIPALSPQ